MEKTNWKGTSSPDAMALSVQLCRFVEVEPPDEDLAYINVAAAAREASAWSGRDPEQLRPVFDLAEAILDHGTGELQTLIVVGLFEDLQNYLLRGEGDMQAVVELLGPKSRLGWEAVNQFWAGDSGAIARFFQETLL